MNIKDDNHPRYRTTRVKGYDIWFRRAKPVLVSKRKMTEEDKEIMQLHWEKPRNKFVREQYKPLGD